MSHKTVPFNTPAPWWCLLIPLVQGALLALMMPAGTDKWLISGSFVAISALASWRLFSDGRPYSLNKAWWLFTLVFLGIIPSMQLAANMMPWQSADMPSRLMLPANGLILLCLGVYEAVRIWASRNFIPQPEQARGPVSPVLIRQFAYFAPAIMLSCGAALAIVYGYKGLFSFRHMEAALPDYSTSFRLIFDNVLRGTMLWCCIAAIILYRQHKLGGSTLLLVLIPGMLFNFPLSLPGYLTLPIYLCWILATGFPLFRRQHAFSAVMLAVFLILAPVFGLIRYPGAASPIQTHTDSPGQHFQQAALVSHYDAWSSMCRAMQYSSENGTTYGRQLIGVTLFFVPRSVWPAKPVGSGAFLYSSSPYGFHNRACTYLAEGFINFGVAGSLVFAALLALLIARYDGWYWRRGGRVRFTLPRLFYFVSIGMLFFILRGDLMSSFAWLTGFALVCTFWQAIFFWRLKRSEQ